MRILPKETIMSTWTYRLAEQGDAIAFDEWVRSNPQIDVGDVRRTLRGNNPTCLFLVACCDGKPVAFAPVIQQMHLCHLAFAPESQAEDRKSAMAGLVDFACGLAKQMGIREITTLTRSSYPMSHVAVRLGFERDDRELFRFVIPKLPNPKS
jgi:hypothetical protein